MKYTPKMNRQQKKADQKARRDQQMNGSGVHIYQNSSGATLFLPKPAMGGHTQIAPNQKFQGDSYFERMIGQGLRKIATVVPNDPPKFDTPIEHKEEVVTESVEVKQEGETMNEEKLLLDQPERYTQEGQTEQVVVEKKKKLNENNPDQQKDEKPKLINEDPMSGVEIILN